jgi:hypothetical protein
MSNEPNLPSVQQLAAGIPQPAILGLLAANGWREKDVYRALSTHFRQLLGIDIPRRPSSGVAAKDAFFYLLTFSTLATWTLSLGTLAFQLIDRWLADPLFSTFQQQFATYEITWSLAAMLIAFPIYLLISRTLLREAAADPEKLDSSIRKWLTYMALVVAASIFMGDLICALAFLLRGEVTSRFLAKAFVVLALSGGVFHYYFGGLRKTDAHNTAEPDTLPDAGSPRNRNMAILSSAIVALMLILGFLQLGPPRAQRALRADAQRSQQLYELGSQVQNYWRIHASQLPPSIGNLQGRHSDPITQTPYEYVPGQGSQFQLCATFAKESPTQDSNTYPASEFWTHPAGHHCFTLDATAPLPYPGS